MALASKESIDQPRHEDALQSTTNSEKGSDSGKATSWSILVRRIMWALFVVTLVFFIDAALHVLIARQQAGVPILESKALEPLVDQLEIWYYELTSLLTSGWQAVVPH